MSREKKQKLKECQKSYRRAKKSTQKIFNIFSLDGIKMEKNSLDFWQRRYYQK